MTKKLFSAVLLLILAACKGEMQQNLPKPDWNKEKSVRLNKEFAMEEKIQMDIFVDQHQEWDLQKTGSGLLFAVYKEGSGVPAISGTKAHVELEVRLLDNTLCYKTDADEYEEFELNHSDVETGILEGIGKMKVGDRAKLVIPSHLAHGLIGDLDKIPPLATLLVDVNLLNVVK